MTNEIRVTENKKGSLRFATIIDGKVTPVKKEDAIVAVANHEARFVDIFSKDVKEFVHIAILDAYSDRHGYAQVVSFNRNARKDYYATETFGAECNLIFTAHCTDGVASPRDVYFNSNGKFCTDGISKFVYGGYRTPAEIANSMVEEYIASLPAVEPTVEPTVETVIEPIENGNDFDFDLQAAADEPTVEPTVKKEVYRIRAVTDRGFFDFNTTDYDSVIDAALVTDNFNCIHVDDARDNLILSVKPDHSIPVSYGTLVFLGLSEVFIDAVRDTWENFRTVRDNTTIERISLRGKLERFEIAYRFEIDTRSICRRIKRIAEHADKARKDNEARHAVAQSFEPRRERFSDEPIEDTLPTVFADHVSDDRVREEHDAPPETLDEVIDGIAQAFFKVKRADKKYNLGKRGSSFILTAYQIIAEHAIYKAALKCDEHDAANAALDSIKRSLDKIGVEILT